MRSELRRTRQAPRKNGFQKTHGRHLDGIVNEEIMSIFPITPLVRQVQTLITATFEVSEEDAQEYAAELVTLAEGWGSPEAAAKLDWSYRIKKDLGETGKLKWRSDDERKQFEVCQRQKYNAYDEIIRRRG